MAFVDYFFFLLADLICKHETKRAICLQCAYSSQKLRTMGDVIYVFTSMVRMGGGGGVDGLMVK